MLKSNIRQIMLQKRSALSPKEVKLKSFDVINKLLSNFSFKGFDNILLYLPIKNEVQTKELIRKFYTQKKLFLPAYSKKKWVISKLEAPDKLGQVFGNVLQPENINIVDPMKIQVAIVPGVAFSNLGDRLGFGLGVYDQLLKNSRAIKIGLCYDFQIVDELVTESHDIKMDFIVSESGFYQITE